MILSRCRNRSASQQLSIWSRFLIACERQQLQTVNEAINLMEVARLLNWHAVFPLCRIMMGSTLMLVRFVFGIYFPISYLPSICAVSLP